MRERFKRLVAGVKRKCFFLFFVLFSILVNKFSFSECENFLDVGLGRECTSRQGVLKREPGSDSDLFHSPSDDMDSIIFPKVLCKPSFHFCPMAFVFLFGLPKLFSTFFPSCAHCLPKTCCFPKYVTPASKL